MEVFFNAILFLCPYCRRVNVFAVYLYFKMEVRSGGHARSADCGDNITLIYSVAFLHKHIFKVGIENLGCAIAQPDVIAVFLIKTLLNNCACNRSKYILVW